MYPSTEFEVEVSRGVGLRWALDYERRRAVLSAYVAILAAGLSIILSRLSGILDGTGFGRDPENYSYVFLLSIVGIVAWYLGNYVMKSDLLKSVFTGRAETTEQYRYCREYYAWKAIATQAPGTSAETLRSIMNLIAERGVREEEEDYTGWLTISSRTTAPDLHLHFSHGLVRIGNSLSRLTRSQVRELKKWVKMHGPGQGSLDGPGKVVGYTYEPVQEVVAAALEREREWGGTNK